MLSIRPLSQSPDVLGTCIGWTDAEWGAVAGFSLEDWEAEFTRIDEHPTDEVFVAFDGDKPVGMIWLLEHEGIESLNHLTPWLSSLVVDPAYRARGVGRALIKHLETYASYGGDEAIYLLTETPAVYFSADWEVVDTAPLGEKDVFVMRKFLSAPVSAEQY